MKNKSTEKSTIVKIDNKRHDPDFGDRLLEAFDNIKQTEIAKRLDMGDSTISNYANGRLPEAWVLKLFSGATGYSIHWLLTGQKPKKIFLEDTPPILYEIAELFQKVTENSMPTEYSKTMTLLEPVLERLQKAAGQLDVLNKGKAERTLRASQGHESVAPNTEAGQQESKRQKK